LLLGVLGWLVFGYISGVARIIQIRHEMSTVKQEMSAVQSRNKELEGKVREMQRPEYIEKIARTELGLIKPGEVKFVMSKSVDGSNPEARDIEKKPVKANLILH
jgi:cell division protein DivIC